MRILFATNSYPPNLGGAEAASKRIVDILSSRHEVTVLTRPVTKGRKKDKEKGIVELEAHTYYSFMPALGKFLKENEFDVYICFGFAKHFFDAIGSFARKNGKKSIAIPSGYFHTKKMWAFKKAYEGVMLSKSINNYRMMINLTEEEKKFWCNKFGYPSERAVVIPHTLEKGYAHFKPTGILRRHGLKAGGYALYMGRMAANKRIDLLVGAFAKIKTPMKLVVAGRGTDNPQLMALSNEQTLFIGEVSEDEKKELTKNSRVVVFPSEFEGFGLVILEALAFGKPILVSDIPVFREIIKEDAFFFKNNEVSLRAKLEEFLMHPKKVRRFTNFNQEKEYLRAVEGDLVSKKIDVWVQYPWIFPDSPYYKYLFDYPPKNAHFINPAVRSRDVAISPEKIRRSNRLKDVIRKFIYRIKIPIPNAHLSAPKRDVSLIHCAHCLSLNNAPWVVDLESAWQIVISQPKNRLAVAMAKRILKSGNCKKIMCWTEDTCNKLRELVKDEEVSKKTVVVYPAVPSHRKNPVHKKITLLFIARYFDIKGGYTAVKVIDALTKKYPHVNGIIVSETPPAVIEEYEPNKKIKFFGLMDREKLANAAYSKADIFIYPGYSDSFGWMFLEAMSFGLPIITADGIARRELVKDGQNGFVAARDVLRWPTKEEEEVILQEMIEKTELLVKNAGLRRKIGDHNYREVKEGRFSITERNRKMERVYDEAAGKLS